MCYSSKCIWELSSGDCGFPTNKAVKDKYPLPLCTIPFCEDSYIPSEEEIEEIKKLAKIK
jgi:hypothetical protein